MIWGARVPKPIHKNMNEHDRQMDALHVIQRCLFCTWTSSGTALEGRTEAIAHRLKAHPEIKPARRGPTRNLRSFRQPALKSEDREEIFVERDKRARLLGISIDSGT